MRKLLASFLIVSVLWASIIAPARAFAPLVGLAYLTGANGLQGSLIGASLLASAVAAITLTSDGNESVANGSNVAIQIQLDPYTPLITPDSAQSPQTSPFVQQVQIVSDTETHPVYHCPTAQYESQSDCLASLNQDSCCSIQYDSIISETATNYVAQYHRVYESGGGQSTFSKSTVAGCSTGATWNGTNCVTTQNSCPAGYAMDTTTQSCNLINTDTQVVDNKTQIVRQNNEFIKNPNDPDPIPENLLVRPSDVIISTPEHTTTVHINADGTITVTEIKPTENNTTTKEVVNISSPTPGSSPQVTSKSKQQYSGQESGPADPASPVNSPQVPGTGSGTPSSSASGTTVLNLPANLAKTEDVQEVRDKLTTANEKLTDINKSVRTDVDSSVLADKNAVTGKFDQGNTDVDKFFDDAKADLDGMLAAPLDAHGVTWEWLPEIPSADCQSFSYGAGGHVFAWDFCPVAQKIRDLLGYVLYILTAFLLFNIAIGRKPE